MAAIELITAAVCPYAQRTHMTLIEKGLDFERREVDLADKPAWFEEISPRSKVPVVKIGDEVVWESAIVNEFLDERFPEPPLMPRAPFRRALARIWIDHCDARFVGDNHDLLFEKDQARRDELRARVAANLRYIETEGMAKLSDGPYWLGEALSLVDLAYYPFFERMAALRHYRGVEIPDDCARIRAWLALMAERESTGATMNGDAYYIERYAKLADAA